MRMRVPRRPWRVRETSLVERADDLENSADFADLPIAFGAVRVVVMAIDAVRIHSPRGRVAERRTILEDLETVDRIVGLRSQLVEGVPLELVVGPSVLARPERVIAVQPEQHPGLAALADPLA